MNDFMWIFHVRENMNVSVIFHRKNGMKKLIIISGFKIIEYTFMHPYVCKMSMTTKTKYLKT